MTDLAGIIEYYDEEAVMAILASASPRNGMLQVQGTQENYKILDALVDAGYVWTDQDVDYFLDAQGYEVLGWV